MKLTLLSVILGFSVLIASGQWTFSSLSVPTDYMGATVLGSKAYFAGGEDCVNLLSIVNIYDTQTGQWTLDNLSVARELPFATTCGSKVIFAGGVDFYGTGMVYSTVDIFDTITQQWTVEQLSIPRLQAAVVSHGNKVLFAGGTNYQSGATYDIVDIYDVETGEWSSASLSIPRVVWWAKVDDLAIFAGGYSSQQSSKRVDIYNFTTDTWSIDSLSVPRAFIGMTTIGNKVLIAGGMTSGNNASNVVDIYDASTGTWDIANLSLARAFADNQQAVTAGGKAYFVGGGKIHLSGGYWTAAYNVIDIYDEATNTWSVDTMPLSPRVHHAVVANNNKVIIAGGYLMTPPYGCDATVAIYTCPPTSCLPEGIDFFTQEEIDNFQTNYPGCTEIEGDVRIEGENINNLNGLSVLTSIGGSLRIGGTSLEDMSGLEALEYIGTYCTIGWSSMMGFFGNPYLTSLNGFESLTTIGEWLSIADNNLLTDLNGLSSLTSVDNLSISKNGLLSSLSGLDNIETNSLTYMAVFGNPSLVSCEAGVVCNYLANPGGPVDIFANAPGCNNPTEVASACGITLPYLPYGNYYFLSQSDIDQFHENFPGCTTLNGNVTIGYDEEWGISYYNDISNLTGLLGTEAVGGRLMISTWGGDLVSFHGLDSLKTIGGTLHISDNDALTDITSLINMDPNSLTYLWIVSNNSLGNCHIQSICDYLASPNAYATISFNASGCNSPEEVINACMIGIEEMETGGEKPGAGIIITPNPAIGLITISLPVRAGSVWFTMFNTGGGKVIEQKLTGSETQIDISTLPRGVYFVRLQNEKMVVVGKVMKE